jgi:hypothetical protein
MIILYARRMRERTAALAATGLPLSHAAPTGASAAENSLAHIWHSYLILRLSVPLAAAARPSVLASSLVNA